MYQRHCRRLLPRYGLDECIDVQEGAVERCEPKPERCFDFVLLSMSFMLLGDPQVVLPWARQWLAPEGEIVFAQAMYRERSRFMDIVKPKLKYVTTVDFDRVMYERDFFALFGWHRLGGAGGPAGRPRAPSGPMLCHRCFRQTMGRRNCVGNRLRTDP